MDDRTLIDTVLRQARERPDAPAYRAGTVELTFRDVELATNRIGNALRALGIAPGDRVACLTKYHVECTLLSLAACKIGAVCMPVNWRLAPSEIEFIVHHGCARFLMVDAEFLPVAGDLFKTATFEYGNRIRVGGESWDFVSRMTIRDAMGAGNVTTLTFSSPRPETHAPSLFNVNNVVR